MKTPRNIFTLNLLLSLFVLYPAKAANETVLIAASPVLSPPHASSSYYTNGMPNSYNYAPGAYAGVNPYANPYYQNYPAYGRYPYYNNPYAPTYLGRYNIGGVIQPVYGAPQLISGSYYGVNIGGSPYTFWQAPSGFYYPWSSGFAYSDRPILTAPPNGGSPLQTQPPVPTVISDLDSFLDKAKEQGKISPESYQNLRERAQHILSKERSTAQSNGGVLDPDQEVELRKEINSLSAEVAYRVSP